MCARATHAGAPLQESMANFESFCERCGQPAQAGQPAARGPLKVDLLRALVGRRPSEVRAEPALRLCLGCRGYICNSCWNDAVGVCQGCAPVEPQVTEAGPSEQQLEEAPAWPTTDLERPAVAGSQARREEETGTEPAAPAEAHVAEVAPASAEGPAAEDAAPGSEEAMPAVVEAPPTPAATTELAFAFTYLSGDAGVEVGQDVAPAEDGDLGLLTEAHPSDDETTAAAVAQPAPDDQVEITTAGLTALPPPPLALAAGTDDGVSVELDVEGGDPSVEPVQPSAGEDEPTEPTVLPANVASPDGGDAEASTGEERHEPARAFRARRARRRARSMRQPRRADTATPSAAEPAGDPRPADGDAKAPADGADSDAVSATEAAPIVDVSAGSDLPTIAPEPTAVPPERPSRPVTLPAPPRTLKLPRARPPVPPVASAPSWSPRLPPPAPGKNDLPGLLSMIPPPARFRPHPPAVAALDAPPPSVQPCATCGLVLSTKVSFCRRCGTRQQPTA